MIAASVAGSVAGFLKSIQQINIERRGSIERRSWKLSSLVRITSFNFRRSAFIRSLIRIKSSQKIQFCKSSGIQIDQTLWRTEDLGCKHSRADREPAPFDGHYYLTKRLTVADKTPLIWRCLSSSDGHHQARLANLSHKIFMQELSIVGDKLSGFSCSSLHTIKQATWSNFSPEFSPYQSLT